MKRTHRCGEIDAGAVGGEVCLQGWVWRRRDLGGLIFIDLRDRSGSVQCVLNPESAPASHAVAGEWRSEYVVELYGTVVARDANTVNPKQPNGDVEVLVSRAQALSRSKTPFFVIEDDARASEELRLKHRFLDLRRAPLQRSITLRHRLALATRNLLDARGFLEIETPMLTRSTPEGARDYLVPSRVHPGKFYALPQSPQLFKQLLMVSGFDRYFQIVRCFRDEDLRADRQPEFTQIDMEMSFVSISDVQELTEELVRRMLAIAGHDSDVTFERLSFREAIDRFGSDRPDMRYGVELADVTEVFVGSGFRAFAQVAETPGHAIKALRVPGAGEWGRARLDKLTEAAKAAGARGLVWLKVHDGEVTSPVSKFIGEGAVQQLLEATGTGPGDALLLVGDEWERAATVLGVLRSSLAAGEGWIAEELRFLWVTEFPLLQHDEEANRFVARHHPFTAPMEEDMALLETEPLAVRAQAYDLVLNGVELGGGSIRIHRRDVQQRVFDALDMDSLEASEKFGFLLRALEYGAPPHGGIALGFDRIVMMMAGLKSLRDVIAFPKTTTAADSMTGAPGIASPRQLQDLHIELRPEAAELLWSADDA